MSARAATVIVCDACDRRRFAEVGGPIDVRPAAVRHGWVIRPSRDLCPDCAVGEELAS